MEAILREVENNIFANSTLYLTPRFLGYINAGGNQASVLGELLASAVNQICAMWHFSPAASEVERRVIRWIAQFIGYAGEGRAGVSVGDKDPREKGASGVQCESPFAPGGRGFSAGRDPGGRPFVDRQSAIRLTP